MKAQYGTGNKAPVWWIVNGEREVKLNAAAMEELQADEAHVNKAEKRPETNAEAIRSERQFDVEPTDSIPSALLTKCWRSDRIIKGGQLLSFCRKK